MNALIFCVYKRKKLGIKNVLCVRLKPLRYVKKKKWILRKKYSVIVYIYIADDYIDYDGNFDDSPPVNGYTGKLSSEDGTLHIMPGIHL